MTQALLVSNALLWLCVIVLGLVVLALVRQVGLLHERIAPVGALVQAQGPVVGEPAPVVEALDLSGRRVTVGGPSQRTLLFFLSPTCPVCDKLLPTLHRVVRAEQGRTRLVLASDGGDAESHRLFVREKALLDHPYLLSTEVGLAYQVAKLPTAVLIDEKGIVRARGLVNSREHLESLFRADELGVSSIQDHLARERDANDAGPRLVVLPSQDDKPS